MINLETLPLGTYCCVDTAGIPAAAIRLSTRSAFNHSFVSVGNGYIVEATRKGASVNHAHNYAGARHIISNADEPLTYAQRFAIAVKAYEMLGTPYGFLDILGLAVKAWVGYEPGFLLDRVEHERASICSQLVATCYAYADITLFPSTPYRHPATVTPGDLALRIDDRPWDTTGAPRAV